ncbi:MAG: hypothetical protein JWO92_2333 [Chitinophagaceae bacterium]|nr:hypothetical protein [Chitinophagaceae bacterium]MDB5222116.1 hypothetical protein [Chitinophagaceae bacterium]
MKGDCNIDKREREILQLITFNLTSKPIAHKLFLSLQSIEFHAPIYY